MPTATATQLASTDGPVFMLSPTNREEGEFIADHALDSMGAARIAIVYVADAYGDGIREGVVARLATRGATLAGAAALSNRACMPDSLVARGVVQSLVQRSKPDLVIVALGPQLSVCIIHELLDADNNLRILTADSFEARLEVTRRLTLRERAAVWSVVFWTPGSDSLSQAFVARTQRIMGRDPLPSDALTYDAFMLAAAAVREGHHTPTAVTRWLRSLGTPGTPPFAGVTGPIAFNGSRASILQIVSVADTSGSH